MLDLGKKIDEIIRGTNQNKTEFAKSIDISKSRLSNYISGLREPDQEMLNIIIKKYNVNPSYFYLEDVPMFLNDISENHQKKPNLAFPRSFTIKDIELARKWINTLKKVISVDFSITEKSFKNDDDFINYINNLKEDLELSAEIRNRKTKIKQ